MKLLEAIAVILTLPAGNERKMDSLMIESQWDKEASKYEHGTGIAVNEMAK